MRVLHAVTQREKLVASGTYRYSRVGEMLKGEEHFTIHALPDGSRFVRIDYDWRALDGTSQLIEALTDPPAAGGRFQRVVAQLVGPAGVARESMDFYPDRVLVGVSGVDGVRRDIEVPMDPDYVVVLLKTTLIGIAASRWPSSVGEVTAFGGYRSSEDRALVLKAALHRIGMDELTVGGQTIAAEKVEVHGEFVQTLWLDPAAGTALRRVTGELTAEIRDYARGSELRE